jgi:hypothetical protein
MFVVILILVFILTLMAVLALLLQPGPEEAQVDAYKATTSFCHISILDYSFLVILSFIPIYIHGIMAV